jgi:hypothetical protein
MSPRAPHTALRWYLRGCAWPCPPDIARAIAADNGAPLALLLALELLPVRLYDSEDALLRALTRAALRPCAGCFGALGVLSLTGPLESVNGHGRGTARRR